MLLLYHCVVSGFVVVFCSFFVVVLLFLVFVSFCCCCAFLIARKINSLYLCNWKYLWGIFVVLIEVCVQVFVERSRHSF